VSGQDPRERFSQDTKTARRNLYGSCALAIIIISFNATVGPNFFTVNTPESYSAEDIARVSFIALSSFFFIQFCIYCYFDIISSNEPPKTTITDKFKFIEGQIDSNFSPETLALMLSERERREYHNLQQSLSHFLIHMIQEIRRKCLAKVIPRTESGIKKDISNLGNDLYRHLNSRSDREASKSKGSGKLDTFVQSLNEIEVNLAKERLKNHLIHPSIDMVYLAKRAVSRHIFKKPHKLLQLSVSWLRAWGVDVAAPIITYLFVIAASFRWVSLAWFV